MKKWLLSLLLVGCQTQQDEKLADIAYRIGRMSYQVGRSPEDNPYVDIDLKIAWIDGYVSAMQEQVAKKLEAKAEKGEGHVN